jgi:hypothetical protein
MRKWNPYDTKVTDDWAGEFAKKQNIPKWYARLCLHIGCFITNVEYIITGKIKNSR